MDRAPDGRLHDRDPCSSWSVNGPDDCLRQPEGRRREDDHRRERRRIPGRRRCARPRRRPRPPGQRHKRPRSPSRSRWTVGLRRARERRTPRRARRSPGVPGLDLVPSSIALAGAEVELAALPSANVVWPGSCRPSRTAYDYIFLDCPPSLGLLTVNALTAADAVLVPLQCEYYALEGLSQLIATIHLVRDHLNPALAVNGVVLTMFDARTNLSAEVAAEVRRHLARRRLRDGRPAERPARRGAQPRPAHRPVRARRVAARPPIAPSPPSCTGAALRQRDRRRAHDRPGRASRRPSAAGSPR